MTSRIPTDMVADRTSKTKLSDTLGSMQTSINTNTSSLATKVSKGELLINVKDSPYNAVGNGSVDDTIALQNAINDAQNLGVRLILPKGTYLVTSTLRLTGNIYMYGDTRYRTKIQYNGSGALFANTIPTTIAGNISISDLEIDLGTSPTSALDVSSIHSSTFERLQITLGSGSQIGVYSSGEQGGVTYSSYYNTLSMVCVFGYSFTTPSGTGYKFENDSNSNRLFACRSEYVSTCVSVGNASDYSNNISIVGCAFENFDTGIDLYGTGNSVISCRFENAGYSGHGVAIHQRSTGSQNTAFGNYISSSVQTVTQNDSATFEILGMQYGTMTTQYLSHIAGGGWKSDMDLRNYRLNNATHLNLQNRTTDSSTNNSFYVINGILKFRDNTGALKTVTLT